MRTTMIDCIGIVNPMYRVRGYNEAEVLVYQFFFETSEEATKAAEEFLSLKE